ncbi:hypothetical protein TNCV_1157981 [Trichonephila clavipes]|nr:hypothetical protein TNCV_1157981 [Trichonephila clavipes]
MHQYRCHPRHLTATQMRLVDNRTCLTLLIIHINPLIYSAQNYIVCRHKPLHCLRHVYSNRWVSFMAQNYDVRQHSLWYSLRNRLQFKTIRGSIWLKVTMFVARSRRVVVE